MAEVEDEWTLLADAYDDVLLTRLQPLYDCVARLVLGHIEVNKNEQHKLLDYGTGTSVICIYVRLSYVLRI